MHQHNVHIYRIHLCSRSRAHTPRQTEHSITHVIVWCTFIQSIQRESDSDNYLCIYSMCLRTSAYHKEILETKHRKALCQFHNE